jgi:hypothetical protein
MGIISIREDIRAIEQLAIEDPAAPDLRQAIEEVEKVLRRVIDRLKEEEILAQD